MNSCPKCGSSLHVDTGSILDFEEGLIGDPIFFCTCCGYDSEKPQVNSTSTAQPIIQPWSTTPTPKFFGHEGKAALAEGKCPYCDTDDTDGMLFVDKNDRHGGLMECRYCKVSIGWIDNPFEAFEGVYE